MAKRKTHRRKTGHHRRMSGVKGGAIMEVIAIAGGAIAAKFIIKSLAGKMNDKMLNGIVLAGGVFLPKFVKGDFGKGLGAGMIAAGSVGMLNSFGVLQGIGEEAYTMEFISGDNMSVISRYGEDEEEETVRVAGGMGDMSVLSGVDDPSADSEAPVDQQWIHGL